MARYWQAYDYYGLKSGCATVATTAGASAAATTQVEPVLVHGVSLHGCMQRCTARLDCQGVGYHQGSASCRVYSHCEGELAVRPCTSAWCGYMRASALKKGPAGSWRDRNRAPKIELRDQPRPVPHVPMGQNANTSAMMALCPNGEFISCLASNLRRRYPVHALFAPGRLPWREPVQNARAVFGGLQRNCSEAEDAPRRCRARPVPGLG